MCKAKSVKQHGRVLFRSKTVERCVDWRSEVGARQCSRPSPWDRHPALIQGNVKSFRQNAPTFDLPAKVAPFQRQRSTEGRFLMFCPFFQTASEASEMKLQFWGKEMVIWWRNDQNDVSSVKAKLLNRCLLAWESKAGVQISNGDVPAQYWPLDGTMGSWTYIGSCFRRSAATHGRTCRLFQGSPSRHILGCLAPNSCCQGPNWGCLAADMMFHIRQL